VDSRHTLRGCRGCANSVQPLAGNGLLDFVISPLVPFVGANEFAFTEPPTEEVRINPDNPLAEIGQERPLVVSLSYHVRPFDISGRTDFWLMDYLG
jgi:hypothetical protein